MARFGFGAVAEICGLLMGNVPSEGEPPSDRELPLDPCAPAAMRPVNVTEPSPCAGTTTSNVYVHLSPAGVPSTGVVKVTPPVAAKPVKSWMPGIVPPCV